MIRFVCTCGQRFEVADDRVGANFQCPKCHKLLEVPSPEDLAGLNPDGTVKLEAAPVHKSDLASKFRAFGAHSDMRGRLDEPTEPIEPPDAPLKDVAPHYDPETGELVTGFDLRPPIAPTIPEPAPVQVLPVDAVPAPPRLVLPVEQPTLQYTNLTPAKPQVRSAPRPEKPARPLFWWQLPWRLFEGMSLIAIFFVFLTHVVLHFFLILPAANVLLLPLSVLIALAITAHYSNVMEAFGPQERDAVPVLMRSVSLSEDILEPLYALLWAALFAFTPVLFALLIGLREQMLRSPALLIAMGAWGAFVFPAAALTMSTSGALQNLLPTHVFSVILAAPGRYMLACLAFLVGAAGYVLAITNLVFTSVKYLLDTAGTTFWSDLLRSTAAMYACLIVGIYAMHLSAAWLGMIYRTHYEKFNWVWQRHERENRPKPLVAPKPQLGHTVDHERLAEIRLMEAERRARHAEAMRK